MAITPEKVDQLFGWDIEARETFTLDRNGRMMTVPGKRTLVRVDRDHALGVVTKSYGVIQPREIMSFLHACVGEGTVEYINGASFDKGARIYLQARIIGADFDVAGQEHAAYLILGAHNDGTGSFWAGFTPTRLWCMNQLRLAIKNTVSRLSIRHTSRAAERLEQAHAVVERARGYFGTFHATAMDLVRQRFTIQDMRSLAEELWPDPKNERLLPGVQATRARVVQLFDGGQRGAGAINGTKYGALNAVAEYVDHHQSRRGGEEGRLNAVIFGSAPQQIKQAAFERLAA